ncbi:hypothetical protein OH77DRAFT_1393583 [Trametes cingulata]|nr:hypothetical protein OH77DRAFT_1393583 [Trametes cingulata]
MIQETDSRFVIESLTRNAKKHEDTGYILQKNVAMRRLMLAAVREREAAVVMKWIKGHNGHQRNEKADRLAAEGAEKEVGDELDMEIPAGLRLTGAKLAAMTQKLAYRAIRLRKKQLEPLRPSTEKTMAAVRNDIRETYGRTTVTSEEVWTSARTPHVTRECRQFVWKTLHDAFMIGKHWMKPSMSDELRERAMCKKCGTVESMDHILLKCEATGRRKIWEMLKALWARTGKEWKEPTLGAVTAPACRRMMSTEGRRLTNLENLWTVLLTEATYLIWKLRCERVIQNGGQEFTEAEVENRWYALLGHRLDLDRRSAARHLGKRALKPEDVEAMWLPVIEHGSYLVPGWATNGGVLVGIGRNP